MELDMKHWRPSPVFPQRYLVSDDGKVYSIVNDKILKPELTAKGYYRYFLYEKGKERKAKAHRLVALAFIPNPDNKPQIDHINNDKLDNRVENLRWCSNKENANNPITLERNYDRHLKLVAKMNEARRKKKDNVCQQLAIEDII